MYKKLTSQKAAFIGLAAFALLIFASTVFAQPSDPTAPYREFRPANDIASWVMKGLLGAVYESPFSVGAANTMFGQIFIVFNMVVFAVGLVWGSYGVITGIVQTAHEGSVLGKRISPIWFPIRMATGIGGLVPVFGGFSLSQIAMIIATSTGIAFGNYAFNEGINAAANFTALTNPAIAKGAGAMSADDAIQGLFEQRRCEIRLERKLRAFSEQGIAPGDDLLLVGETLATSDLSGRASGTQRDPKLCGVVAVSKSRNPVRSANSPFGFRNAAVNYEAIGDNSWRAYSANFQGLVGSAYRLADKYERAVEAAKTQVNQVPVPFPNPELRALALSYMQAIEASQSGFNVKAIHAGALQSMADKGFFSAGSYYSTLAEVNAAIMQATNSVNFLVEGGHISYNTAPSELSGEFGNMQYGGSDFTTSGIKTADHKGLCPFPSETGNCSLGQAFVRMGLKVGADGAGGAPTLIDPIIAMKNIGDYMMVTGEVLGAVAIAAKVTGGLATGVASVVGEIPVIGEKIKAVSSTVIGLVSSMGEMAGTLAALLFVIGALLSLYIPLVPFLNWISAIVQYCCIVVESMAAAPLWALAHLQSDGDGMGQRTEKGYLYLINLLFRPILMVCGFFAASILVILVGSAVFQMYAGVVANVQGNSVTGLFSIIGFLFIFFVIMNIVIQGMFNLCYELADDVIGWIGSVGKNNIGRDTEGKVGSLFMAGGRFGGTVMGQAMKTPSTGGQSSAPKPKPIP